MKKRTKFMTIALSLALFTLGGLASIPADGTILAGKVLFTETETETGDPETETETDSDNVGYILTRDVCTKTWICPNGTIQLTSGRSFHCTEASGFVCTPADESSCDAPKPDCLRF